MHFRTNMARFLIPKIEEKQKNDDSKWHQTIDRFWDRFFIDFGSVLGANLEPCGPLFRPKTAPEAPRTPPKSLLGDVLGASWGLFTAKCQQERLLGPSWPDFGRFWSGFWDESSILFLACPFISQDVVKANKYYFCSTFK